MNARQNGRSKDWATYTVQTGTRRITNEVETRNRHKGEHKIKVSEICRGFQDVGDWNRNRQGRRLETKEFQYLFHIMTHRLPRSPSLSGSTADGRGVRGTGENSPSATSRDARPSATVPECVHPPGILWETEKFEMVDRWRLLGSGRGSSSASSSSTTGGRLQMISVSTHQKRYHTYSSTPPFHGKPISLNAGRTTSGLETEWAFAVLVGVIESFGTKTGGGSYLE